MNRRGSAVPYLCLSRKHLPALSNSALVAPRFFPRSALGGSHGLGSGLSVNNSLAGLTLGSLAVGRWDTGCRGVTGKPAQAFQRAFRLALAALVSLTLLLPPTTLPAAAASGDRTIYMRHTHTGEVGRFTFKKNGQFDQKVLRELNVFLADWRTKEPAKMDPALFDLLWSVYQDVGAQEPINIVSSYRSPKTNAMLASKSSAVAENSLHMKGKAIDFFIPGVNLGKLRETVMRHQVGGIGYYPTSGSPFVHADTGSVRAWPRMTRAQLKKVFPDGRTLHLPTDGRPLSNEGRQYAEAEWRKCRTVPCGGVDFSSGTTRLASLDSEAPVPANRPSGLLDSLLGKPTTAAVATDAPAEIQLAALGGDPEQRIVSTFEIVAPLPALRRSMAPGGTTADGAPIPAAKSQRMVVATLYEPPSSGTALNALNEIAPKPRVLMSPLDTPVTAYAQDPEAERALRIIIERETTASLPAVDATPELLVPVTAPVQTAALGDGGLDALKGMFDLTFNALKGTAAPEPMALALAGMAEAKAANGSYVARTADLIAPELDHVNETLVHPVYMTASHFAVMTEAEGYLDKETELGPLTGRIGFAPEPEVEPPYDHFIVDAPLLVASN